MAVKIQDVWVRVLEPGLVEIESFSQKGKFYVVDRVERSCTCECFRQRGWCKHLNFVMEHESTIKFEERVWRANREFERWRMQMLLEKLRGFKPLDEKTRKAFEAAGWEYDEELSKMLFVLTT